MGIVGLALVKPVAGLLLAAYLLVSGAIGYSWHQQDVYSEDTSKTGYIVYYPTAWKEGTVTNEFGDFEYGGKVYDSPSEFGINNGRVSKLWIKDKITGEIIINYDRGWETEPKTVEHEIVVDDILEKLTRKDEKPN